MMPIIPVVMFLGGFILIYSAVKDMNPKDVVTSALSGKSPTGEDVTQPGKIGQAIPKPQRVQDSGPPIQRQNHDPNRTTQNWFDFDNHPGNNRP